MATFRAEQFSIRVGEETLADLRAQLPEIMALADRYGLRFGQPGWLPT